MDVDIRIVAVGETVYVLDVQQLEYVENAKAHLYVRHFGVHHETGELSVACREAEQVGIITFERIVLVGQRSPQGAHTEHLSPFQLLDERDAVEEFSVHVVA